MQAFDHCRVMRARARPEVVALECLICTEEDRPIDSRYGCAAGFVESMSRCGLNPGSNDHGAVPKLRYSPKARVVAVLGRLAQKLRLN